MMDYILLASQAQQNTNSLNSGTVIAIFVVVAIAVAAIIYAEFLDRNPKFKLDSYCILPGFKLFHFKVFR
jgi:hypothetical protein